MNMLSSLRTRLALTYLGLIILGFGGLTFLAGRQLTEVVFDDFANNLQRTALLLANELVEPLEDEETNTITTIITRSATTINAQIAVLDLDGNILAATYDAPAQLPIDTFPEFTSARQSNISHHTRTNENGTEYMYTAALIAEHNEELLGYIHIGATTASPRTEARQRWAVLVTSFIVFLLFGLIISGWLVITLTRPLAQLQTTALDMAAGDLTQRVPNPGRDEIGEVGRAFNQMAEQVEAMVKEQRAFASNASHELRTPLTTIRLRTEWLLSDELDEKTTKQYISEVDAEAKRLSGLVNDLILLSRLESNRLEVGQELVDAGRLLRATGRDLEAIATTKEIDLTITIDAPLPPVKINMNHMRVVCRNILDNAIKYTPEGGRVTVTLNHQAPYLVCQVTDNGQGIAPEDLTRIGQRFFRADKAHSRQQQGVGLGLSLVNIILKLYGGDFTIDSPGLGHGTTVTVRWPAVDPKEE
ncbi:MAG TPA: HAMP domain-containing sensor histidine kinase [Anaerolineae bacterium]|nr:HAMP domain-containing sensor histidine kinase [Anaerolineae bacterium]